MMRRPISIRPPERALSRSTGFARKHLLFVCLIVGVLAPSQALAHVKWFTDATEYPLRTDLIFSERTLLWLITSALAVVGLTVLQRRFGRCDWPAIPLFRRMTVGAPTILAIQAAIALIACAARSTLLAPNLPLPEGPVGLAVTGLEVAVAFSFVTGIADWVGALVLIGLVPMTALLVSPLDVVEQFFWVGIGVAVLVIGRSSSAGERARPWFWRRNPAYVNRAVACLRIATGVSLIALALGEKLWNPDLGRAFMSDHAAFNVFHSVFGVSAVSDDVFVLLIGLTEAAIGAALISGRMTRLVVLGGWLPFHLGIPLLPNQELIGHLPIFGIMYVLLVHASATPVAATEQPRRARAIGASTPSVRRLPVPVAGRVRHVRQPAAAAFLRGRTAYAARRIAGPLPKRIASSSLAGSGRANRYP
jgi:hypothetical protein